ncbi:uncharacterized protein LOC114583989 [Podarcis muralis]
MQMQTCTKDALIPKLATAAAAAYFRHLWLTVRLAAELTFGEDCASKQLRNRILLSPSLPPPTGDEAKKEEPPMNSALKRLPEATQPPSASRATGWAFQTARASCGGWEGSLPAWRYSWAKPANWVLPPPPPSAEAGKERRRRANKQAAAEEAKEPMKQAYTLARNIPRNDAKFPQTPANVVTCCIKRENFHLNPPDNKTDIWNTQAHALPRKRCQLHAQSLSLEAHFEFQEAFWKTCAIVILSTSEKGISNVQV